MIREFTKGWNDYARGYLLLKQGHGKMKKLLEEDGFNTEMLPTDLQKIVVKVNPKGILMIALERLGRAAREDEELLREYELPKVAKPMIEIEKEEVGDE